MQFGFVIDPHIIGTNWAFNMQVASIHIVCVVGGERQESIEIYVSCIQRVCSVDQLCKIQRKELQWG